MTEWNKLYYWLLTMNNDKEYIGDIWKRFTMLFLSIWILKLAFKPIEINGNLYFTQN